MNKEKQKLIPELRFSEFANDGEWKEKTIDDIKTIVTDYVANGSFASLKENVEVVSSKDYAYYIRLTDLRAGLGHKAQKYVTKKSYDFLKKSSLSGDEILMANIGANVGEIWQMPIVDKPSSLAPNMIMAKFTGNAVDKFIYYFLKSELGKRNIAITISGNAHPKINKTEFKQVKLVLPNNEEEQQKIANCLSSLDNLITAETEKLDHLKDHKKGLLQQLFPANGKTKPQFRFPEFENDGDWEENMFDDLIQIIDGDRGVNYPKQNDFSNDGYCLFLNAKNVTKQGFAFNKVQFISKEKDKSLRKGKLKRFDIILTTRGSVGQFAYYSDKILFNHLRINSGMVILRVKNTSIVSGFFYKYCFSNIIKSEIKDLEFGNAQKQLTVSIIKKLSLIFPKNKKEQQKIANCLSSADDLIEIQITKIEALKNHKKGLMQKLFPNVNDII